LKLQRHANPDRTGFEIQLGPHPSQR
jgi:hypothetical protein